MPLSLNSTTGSILARLSDLESKCCSKRTLACGLLTSTREPPAEPQSKKRSRVRRTAEIGRHKQIDSGVLGKMELNIEEGPDRRLEIRVDAYLDLKLDPPIALVDGLGRIDRKPPSADPHPVLED